MKNQRKQQRKTTAKKTKKKTNALNTKKPAKKINKRGKNTGQKNKIYFRVSLRAQAVACARNKAQQAFLPAQRPPSESLFFCSEKTPTPGYQISQWKCRFQTVSRSRCNPIGREIYKPVCGQPRHDVDMISSWGRSFYWTKIVSITATIGPKYELIFGNIPIP